MRTRLRRIGEASVVAGCIAISEATAFRDVLWPVFGSGSLTSIPALVALTLGAGLGTSMITAALLLTCTRGASPRDRDGAASA